MVHLRSYRSVAEVTFKLSHGSRCHSTRTLIFLGQLVRQKTKSFNFFETSY